MSRISGAVRPRHRAWPGMGLVILACLALMLAVSASATAAAPPPPRLGVRAAILVEPSTGQWVYADNANRELAIASTTKLMTALVTLRHVHHLDTMFTEPDWYAAAADSQIGLVPGERMSVHDLLLALLLPSADDAAEDLAYNVGHGSIGRFVAMMNAEARRLGLDHTHYSTPIGLDTPGNYSSAADLVKLADYDMTHSAYFARVVALTHAVLRTGSHVRYVVNRNDLVGQYPWIDGVKTGHTNDAGYVLVASGQRHGMTLLSAVLGTSSEASRDANTLALLDYGFANFHLARPVHAGQVLARPTVKYNSATRAVLVAAAPFRWLVSNRSRVRVRVDAPAQLTGPIARGTREGTAVVSVDGRPRARIALLLARALPAVSSLTLAVRFFTKPLTLFTLFVVIGVCGAVAFIWRRRRRSRTGRAEFRSA